MLRKKLRRHARKTQRRTVGRAIEKLGHHQREAADSTSVRSVV
jgi:hypothetical protein